MQIFIVEVHFVRKKSECFLLLCWLIHLQGGNKSSNLLSFCVSLYFDILLQKNVRTKS